MNFLYELALFGVMHVLHERPLFGEVAFLFAVDTAAVLLPVEIQFF